MSVVLRFCTLVLGLVAAVAAGAADDAANQRARDIAAMIDVYVDGCIRIDQTLREACGDSPARVPAPYKTMCALPKQTFKSRTAAKYAAWRAVHAAELEAQAEKIAANKAKSASGFDRQLRGGRERVAHAQGLRVSGWHAPLSHPAWPESPP
jgi:hypothetical protein